MDIPLFNELPTEAGWYIFQATSDWDNSPDPELLDLIIEDGSFLVKQNGGYTLWDFEGKWSQKLNI